MCYGHCCSLRLIDQKKFPINSSQWLWSCGRSHLCEPRDLQQGLFLPLNDGGINKYQAYFLHFHAYLTIRQWKPGRWSLSEEYRANYEFGS